MESRRVCMESGRTCVCMESGRMESRHVYAWRVDVWRVDMCMHGEWTCGE